MVKRGRENYNWGLTRAGLAAAAGCGYERATVELIGAVSEELKEGGRGAASLGEVAKANDEINREVPRYQKLTQTESELDFRI